MNIPRQTNRQVKAILDDKTRLRHDKAVAIYRINYDLCSLETDGRLPSNIPSVNQIEKAIEENGF